MRSNSDSSIVCEGHRDGDVVRLLFYNLKFLFLLRDVDKCK